jgi:hypothetical protein
MFTKFTAIAFFAVSACMLTMISSAVFMACGSTTPSATCNGSRLFPITVVDSETRQVLASPLIAIEGNGLTADAPNPVGDYVAGGQGDSNGTWGIPLACGRYGVHTFAGQYHCQSTAASNNGTLTVGMVANGPDDRLPVIESALWTHETLQAGEAEPFTVMTTAASADAEDRVTAVLMVESTTAKVTALTLVQAMPTDAPETQTWTGNIRMPSRSGTYTYNLVAATDSCMSSKIKRLDIAAN